MSNVSSLLAAATHGCNLPLQLTRLTYPTFGLSKWRRKFIEARERLQHWQSAKRGSFPFYHYEPSDWFSGVWTLQEAYLRPNMVLADKDWNILCDSAGEPISLEELFALSHVVDWLEMYGTQILGGFLIKGHGIEDAPVNEFMEIHERSGVKKDFPPGPRQLSAMIPKTHLFSKSRESRIDPLIQANGRLCTAGRNGRAEAIMSSLGVTDWFKAKPRVQDKDLVRDMYPLEFLREAAAKIGPDFYLTSNESPSPWLLFSPSSRVAGTMLPFGRARDTRYKMRSLTMRGTPPCGDASDLHPSVTSWEIQRNGAVRIRLAAIFASNKEIYPLADTIVMLGFWNKPGVGEVTRMSDWLSRQNNKLFDTYAVSLTNGKPGVQHTGLLLRGRQTNQLTRLVKVGYFVNGVVAAVPIARAVNWEVV